MTKGPVIHGALLAGALIFSYKTWTKEKGPDSATIGEYTVWNEPESSFVSLAFDGDGKSVKIEKRGQGGDQYLWGTVSRSTKKPKSPAKPGEPAKPGAPGDSHDDGHGHGAPPKDAPPIKDGKVQGVEKGKPGNPLTTPPGKDAKPAASPAKPEATPATKPEPAKDVKKDAPPTSAPKVVEAGGPATPPPPAASPTPADQAGEEDAAGPAAEPPEETITTTKEFPVGKEGIEMAKNFSSLKALRDLGVLDDKKKTEFGLTDAKENLTVFFTGGKEHSLIVGGRSQGGGDRYVLDAASGKGYVISSTLMSQIDGAENSLSLKQIHSFAEDYITNEVEKLELDTEMGQRSIVKKIMENDKAKQAGWADAKKPDDADQTLTNFLSQLNRLKPSEYDSKFDPASATKVLTVSYRNKSGAEIGKLELVKKMGEVDQVTETDKKAEMEYYVRTKETRVFGKANRLSAERVENDVPMLFGKPPKDPPPEPAKPAASPTPALGPVGPAPAQSPPKMPANMPRIPSSMLPGGR